MEWNQPATGLTSRITFIELCVIILSDPLLCDIQDPVLGVAGIKTLTRFKSQPRYTVKGNTVATTVTSMSLSEHPIQRKLEAFAVLVVTHWRCAKSSRERSTRKKITC